MFSLIFLKAALIISPALAINWCALTCGTVPHTMCKYKQITDTGHCSDIQDIQTDEGREQILELHNSYRNALAGGDIKGINDVKWPKSANMRAMEYDSVLEEVALRWAVQCIAGHDECRSIPGFKFVGQNYYMESATDQLDSSASNKKGFDSWVSEISSAPTSLVAGYQHAGSYGHFTQIIWGESYKLGCAKISYKQNIWNSHAMICNYGPAGNLIGAPIYKEGEPCSKCPEKYKCKKGSSTPNLCSAPGAASIYAPLQWLSITCLALLRLLP